MSRGFVLLTSLVVMLLLSAMTALILTEVLDFVVLTESATGSLQALRLAEGGVDLARKEMLGRPMDELLLGENGAADCLGEAGWRNPLSFSDARGAGAERLFSYCDDGRWGPFEQEANETGRTGKVLIRFSNNREESATADDDGLILARVMALLPRGVSASTPVYHHVSMVEARLERMSLPIPRQPLSLWADEGEIEIPEGVVRVVNPSGSAVGIWEGEPGSFSGPLPEILVHPDASSAALPGIQRWVRRESATSEDWWRPQWWFDFLEGLSDLAQTREPQGSGPGLFWYPQGGSLRGEIAGMVVAVGDLTLAEGCRLEGLLVHLGKGRLKVESGSEIRGAVWMFHPHIGASEVGWGQVRLELRGSVLIRWDEAAVSSALRYMPTRIAGWRILFPEMQLEE